jgi:D-tyrosyl-tRNA(Tyr) deacylase
MNDIQWCKDSVLKTKFWSGDDGKPWKKSLIDNNYELLIVSQFTLYGKIYKKGRLDFHHAMAPDAAKLLYDSVVQEFKSEIGADKVQTGEFGALMSVSITNDGPVTIILDSKEE